MTMERKYYFAKKYCTVTPNKNVWLALVYIKKIEFVYRREDIVYWMIYNVDIYKVVTTFKVNIFSDIQMVIRYLD